MPASRPPRSRLRISDQQTAQGFRCLLLASPQRQRQHYVPGQFYRNRIVPTPGWGGSPIQTMCPHGEGIRSNTVRSGYARCHRGLHGGKGVTVRRVSPRGMGRAPFKGQRSCPARTSRLKVTMRGLVFFWSSNSWPNAFFLDHETQQQQCVHRIEVLSTINVEQPRYQCPQGYSQGSCGMGQEVNGAPGHHETYA